MNEVQKKIKVVHFSNTPMAGGPMRMVKALNRHTSIEARLIDLRRNSVFEHDLVFSENADECIEVARQADIINFHNYLTLDSKEFSPIDFNQLKRNGKSFLMYYRTDPTFISGVTGRSIKDIVEYPMPSIVNAQYPERYFMNSYVVKNVMPDAYQQNPILYDVANISSKHNISAAQTRWGTKGYPEFRAILRKNSLEKEHKIFHGGSIPYEKSLTIKSQSKIVLDDMVTGSYHMAAIEGLMLGKPTMVYLDKRMFRLLTLLNDSVPPLINTHLSELSEKLRQFLSENSEADLEGIGREARSWYTRNWNEAKIAKEYEQVYLKLLQDPALVGRQDFLADSSFSDSESIESLDLKHKQSLKLLPWTKERLLFEAKKLAKRALSLNRNI